MAYTIGKKISGQLQKVELNEFGDFILINPNDVAFPKAFGAFIRWIEEKEAELGKTASELENKYKGIPMISHDESGDVKIDSEQFSLYMQIKTELYTECCQRIDEIFGQDALKKYFRVFYEVNPDFIPDEDCIMDFVDEISLVLESIYQERFKRINQKYNKKRKGGSKGT